MHGIVYMSVCRRTCLGQGSLKEGGTLEERERGVGLRYCSSEEGTDVVGGREITTDGQRPNRKESEVRRVALDRGRTRKRGEWNRTW